MQIDCTRARKAFDAYVAPYDAENPRIALKVRHTYRVADLCRAIADDEGLADDDADLAWLCGLLHDLGRFEQLRRWDTFSDAASASHAQLGVDELFGDEGRGPGGIRRFVETPDEDGLIRAAVGLHSGYRLSVGLDERTRLFCDIVRDADKVDIIRVISESDVETILGVDERTFLASGFSADALRGFSERRCLARDERHEPADYLVGLICFAFELRFPASRRAMAEQGYLARVLADPFNLGRPFDRADAQATWRDLAAQLRRYLEEG